jgi:hypothetical protein
MLSTITPDRGLSDDDDRLHHRISDADGQLAARLIGEFLEMPGLLLTARQAARLTGTNIEIITRLLNRLVEGGFLRLTAAGYLRM